MILEENFEVTFFHIDSSSHTYLFCWGRFGLAFFFFRGLFPIFPCRELFFVSFMRLLQYVERKKVILVLVMSVNLKHAQ